jgi:hypothetical protein
LKKALSLIEVLISIVLLSTVIITILQIKDNNIYFLAKFKNDTLYNSYIALTASSYTKDINKNVYLSDIADFKDDNIRKELKQIKINIKNTNSYDIKMPSNDYVQSAIVNGLIYTIKSKNKDTRKTFYTFKLDFK